MVMRWALVALLSHWRKHPVQLLSVLTGLWLATALLTGVQALNSQARESYALASQTLGSQAATRIEARNGGRFEQQAFVDLRRQGWPVSPLLEGRVQLRDAGTSSNEPRRLQVLGLEPITLPQDTAVAGQALQAANIGDFIASPGRTWIALSTLREQHWHEGERPQLSNGEPLPPLQVQPRMAPGLLILDIGAAQRVLQADQQISALVLPGGFDQALPGPWTERLHIVQHAADSDLQRLTASFHLNLDALGLLAFAVGLFIVHAAIGLALEQRRSLLRTLRACGVGARTLILTLTLELLAMALIGGLAGVVSGYGLASLLLPDVAASLRGLYGAEVAGQLSLSPSWWLAGLGLSLGGALLAGASSLWRAARLPLLALAGNDSWYRAHRNWLRHQAWVAGAAALIASAAALWGNSLAIGFILMGALLLAAALGLPLLLSGLLTLAARGVRSALGQWFMADCRQQLPVLSLALMALLLAVAANIGAASMTEGFRQTFLQWLDQRLSAELYVRPNSASQADAIAQWLNTQPQVRATLPVRDVELRLQGWPASISGVVDDPLYREHWPLLEQTQGAWDSLFTSDSLMLSEQLARHLQVKLGDRLTLPADQGPWALTIVGIYADYGNPKGHLLVAGDRLHRHWPSAPIARLNVRSDPAQVSALKTRLQQSFTLDDGRLVDQAQLKQWATQVFERTFTATAALNSLTLGVAGVALFIALLTQSQSRLGQLAPLWALGVGRRQLMLLNLGQTWLLAVLTLVCAVPLGLMLAWCLVAVINVQAFGWRLPLQVFPLQILRLLGLAALATALASAWPLWRLRQSQPTDLLRVFADER
ncbi:MAG: FtsX-like permease family protein [Janthinobacterium lividum]